MAVRTSKLSIRLEPELHDALKVIADESSRSVSDVVNIMLRDSVRPESPMRMWAKLGERDRGLIETLIREMNER